MKVKFKSDFSKLVKLQKALSSDLEVKVGILTGQNSRDDAVTNADVGATHEFGSFTKNIPARSWLRMPIQEKSQQIQKVVLKRASRIKEDLLNGSSIEIYEAIGMAAEAAIQDGFESHGFGKWKPNAPATVKAKGSESPLIDTSQLRGAVLSKVSKKNG